jgi:DNA repair photolyase
MPQSYNVQLCKAKGQRSACGCIESKDIGMYNTCRHMCVYCYANTSDKVVHKNSSLHDVNGDGIINN